MSAVLSAVGLAKAEGRAKAEGAKPRRGMGWASRLCVRPVWAKRMGSNRDSGQEPASCEEFSQAQAVAERTRKEPKKLGPSLICFPA